MTMNSHSEQDSVQLLRPMQYAEHRLLTRILDGTWPPGAALPAERVLAQEIGVTRSTLRETLQRLAREGWIIIQHGKPTLVNDYWREGGVRLLGTMALYADYLPADFIVHLLDMRVELLPPVAAAARRHAREDIMKVLAGSRELGDQAEAFADYDWNLQTALTRACGNPVYSMIWNDFRALFQTMGRRYFAWPQGRAASRRYYDRLGAALLASEADTRTVVREAMLESLEIWRRNCAAEKGGPHAALERMG